MDRQLIRRIENDYPYPLALEFRRLNTKEYLAYDETRNSELSLDDIFSRLSKEEKGKRKVIGVPFKFLDAYTQDDKNIFFGRDIETDDIFRKLYSGKLLLVYGKSGTGKSSIINCGLISRIPQEDIYAINIRCGRKHRLSNDLSYP